MEDSSLTQLNSLASLTTSSSQLSRTDRSRRKIQLTTESGVEEFKRFRDVMKSPAISLSIDVAQETTTTKTTSNPVNLLCEQITQSLQVQESTLSELVQWKDEFLQPDLPSSIHMTFGMLFSRFLRSRTAVHGPLFELMRVSKIYSDPWSEKHMALREMEEEFKRQRRTLDIAIRKLEFMKSQNERIRRERTILNWERIVRLMLHDSGSDCDDDEEMQVQPNEQVIPTESVTEPEVNHMEEPVIVNNNADKSGGGVRLEGMRESLGFVLTKFLRRHHPEFDDYFVKQRRQRKEYPALVGDLFEKTTIDDEIETNLRRTLSEACMRDVEWSQHRFRSNSTNAILLNNLTLNPSDNLLLEPALENNQTLSDSTKPPKPTLIRKQTSKAKLEPLMLQQQRPTKNHDQKSLSQKPTTTKQASLKDDIDDDVNFKAATSKVGKTVAQTFRKRFDDVFSDPADEILKQLDVENTWFSVQDVMELVLLHTKQLQLMKQSFDGLSWYVNRNEILLHENRFSVWPGPSSSTLPLQPELFYLLNPQPVIIRNDRSAQPKPIPNLEVSDLRGKSTPTVKGKPVAERRRRLDPVENASEFLRRLEAFMNRKMDKKKKLEDALKQQELREAERLLVLSAASSAPIMQTSNNRNNVASLSPGRK